MAMAALAVAVLLATAAATSDAPPCRFAPKYTNNEVLHNPEQFAQDFLYWEGKFHQNDVGYNTANALTYDGTLLDWTTGERTEKHPFSAASKEVGNLVAFRP